MQVGFSPVNYSFYANNQVKTNKSNSQTFRGCQFYQSLNEITNAIGKLASDELSPLQKQLDLNEIVTTLRNTIEKSDIIKLKDIEDGKLIQLVENFAPKDARDLNSRKYANEILRLARVCNCSDSFVNNLEKRLGNKGLLSKLGYISKYNTTTANVLGEEISAARMNGTVANNHIRRNTKGRDYSWKMEERIK